MDTGKLEYDSSLGGHVVLANHVVTYRYAASCVREMRYLLHAIRNPGGRKLVYQKLPRNMRRRAMSHNPKRLPRKYHKIHIAQMAKSGTIKKKKKRPSRKYRRKPCNLLKEYIRRQRQHVWLETHIWHAKRFHMVNRWNHRLPYASCCKMYRASYRATADKCLMQDISYYACLQLDAPLDAIQNGFAKLTSVQCGLSVTARTFVSGRREGSVELFRLNQYPEGSLGRVSFMWRPVQADNTTAAATRRLWLWFHPSGYQAALEELIKAFNLISTKSVMLHLDAEEHEIEVPGGDNVGQQQKREKSRHLQFMTRTLAFERIKRYTNVAGDVCLSELKDTMNRFRLTGPRSHKILQGALRVKAADVDGEPDNWFRSQLLADANFERCHLVQSQYWQQCAHIDSATELMSNQIIALNIHDPRIHRPQRNITTMPPQVTDVVSAVDVAATVDASADLAYSALWLDDVRNDIGRRMMCTHAYCTLRTKHAIVPGSLCKFEREMQPVPVLLVQRPGSQDAQYKRLNYGGGWDVIVPPGYGMHVWLALIMWGARPGGLREHATVARELGTEELLPDTVGGRQQSGERYLELRQRYFRMPTNRRCNYNKLSIVSPFRAPFAALVRDWQSLGDKTPTVAAESSTAATTFFVLRDRTVLQQLQLACCNNRNCAIPQAIPSHSIVQVQLRMKHRGNPGDFALICLPTAGDFKRNLKLMRLGSKRPVYEESMRRDPGEKARKVSRSQHKTMLKRLRRRRLREKRNKQERSTVKVHIRAAGTSHLIATQWKAMCALWLPETYASERNGVRLQCSRQVFGYVTNSAFSFTEAIVCVVGYVTINGLHELLKLCRTAHMKEVMCLIRATNSLCYRFATIKVNVHI